MASLTRRALDALRESFEEKLPGSRMCALILASCLKKGLGAPVTMFALVQLLLSKKNPLESANVIVDAMCKDWSIEELAARVDGTPNSFDMERIPQERSAALEDQCRILRAGDSLHGWIVAERQSWGTLVAYWDGPSGMKEWVQLLSYDTLFDDITKEPAAVQAPAAGNDELFRGNLASQRTRLTVIARKSSLSDDGSVVDEAMLSRSRANVARVKRTEYQMIYGLNKVALIASNQFWKDRKCSKLWWKKANFYAAPLDVLALARGVDGHIYMYVVWKPLVPMGGEGPFGLNFWYDKDKRLHADRNVFAPRTLDSRHCTVPTVDEMDKPLVVHGEEGLVFQDEWVQLDGMVMSRDMLLLVRRLLLLDGGAQGWVGRLVLLRNLKNKDFNRFFMGGVVISDDEKGVEVMYEDSNVRMHARPDFLEYTAARGIRQQDQLFIFGTPTDYLHARGSSVGGFAADLFCGTGSHICKDDGESTFAKFGYTPRERENIIEALKQRLQIE